MPVVVGVILAVQDATVALPASVHEPLSLKRTIPVGLFAAPAPVSVTVVSQRLSCPIKTDAGEHDTLDEVGRPVTVSVAAAAPESCVASPP
jgi:hypothetical protein